MPLPLVVAEVAGDPGGREDRVIESVLVSSRPNEAVRQIDSLDFILKHRDVALRLQHRAERRGDVRGRQTAGHHLVEQRLKQVVIRSIDERDRDRDATQPR
ncbi:MAG: hypothetical protein AAGJ46_15535 [Planctomycetota bacterium]